MNLIARIAAVLVAAIVPIALTAGPAAAYPTTRHLVHVSPDDGYDAAIIATCSWASKTNRYVAEGHSLGCNMEGVYVRADEQIKCYEGATTRWQIWFDARGWHRASYAPLYGCVVQRD